MNKNALNTTDYQKKVLEWFDIRGRKDLPWQQNKTPYRVWVSEIMLQQTQVSTVIPYFERFMGRFPDVISLAKAAEDEVLHQWTGLGYYSRARNLHRAAKRIADEFEGQFPDSLDALQQLPGIGRSTAGAILSIAFQKPTAILDGNVKRVLTRLYNIAGYPGDKKISDHLWKIAEALTPAERVADYTQAIMDLGATICVRGKPQCTQCPLNTLCEAYPAGTAKALPCPKPKKILPIRQSAFLILQNNHHVLLQKRPSPGIWGGLWSLPECQHALSQTDIADFCHQEWNIKKVKIKKIKLAEPFRHTFSHFHLDIHPVLVTLSHQQCIMEDNQQIWYNLREPQTIGLPTPIKKILRNLT